MLAAAEPRVAVSNAAWRVHPATVNAQTARMRTTARARAADDLSLAVRGCRRRSHPGARIPTTNRARRSVRIGQPTGLPVLNFLTNPVSITLLKKYMLPLMLFAWNGSGSFFVNDTLPTAKIVPAVPKL